RSCRERWLLGRDGELFPGSQKDAVAAGAPRSCRPQRRFSRRLGRIGNGSTGKHFDFSVDDGDDRGSLLLVDIELSAHGNDAGRSAVNDERTRGVVSYTKQRLSLEQIHIAPVF